MSGYISGVIRHSLLFQNVFSTCLWIEIVSDIDKFRFYGFVKFFLGPTQMLNPQMHVPKMWLNVRGKPNFPKIEDLFPSLLQQRNNWLNTNQFPIHFAAPYAILLFSNLYTRDQEL